jgi:hypothetical protein
VRSWIARPPTWLEIRVPGQKPGAELMKADLDEGERDAILLAQELDADELIIDDMRGRQEAQRRHLHFIGTLGVLRTAGRRGLLDFKAAVDLLQRTNFYIAQGHSLSASQQARGLKQTSRISSQLCNVVAVWRYSAANRHTTMWAGPSVRGDAPLPGRTSALCQTRRA